MPSVVGQITKGAAFTGIVAGEEVKLDTPGTLATVDGAADYLLVLDATDGVVKKVLADNLPDSGDTHPIADTTAIVKGSADATKLVRVEADGVATGTTRILTMADQDIDLTPGTGSFATEAEGTLAASALQDVVDDTTPQLGGNLDLNGHDLYDANGNEQLTFQSNAAAVNHCMIRNVATGVSPVIYAIGDDANINLGLMGKGTGVVTSNSSFYVTGDITVTGTVDGVDVAAHDASTTAHGATGANVGTTNSQTLTNKTIDADNNTVTNIGKTELEAAYQTRAGVFYIADPVAGDAVPNILLPDDVSFVRIRVQCDVGTVTCNIEHRAKTAPFAAGTDIVSADIVGDATGVEKTSADFAASGAVAADRHLYATVTSVTGSPTEVKIDFEYTVD